MSMTQVGVRSLLAVNSWIGLINSNLQGASRVGYKTVRPHLTDGAGYLYTQNEIFTPLPTLNVQATSMEWAQGSIINSEEKTHFALQGEGFFVVVDAAGRYYLTRDGEFHWDGNGYLVNSAGLRVVSSGQDFVRMDRRDRSDIFDVNGASEELLRYGDKSLLVVDVANRDGLRMSQYGSTVFLLDGDLPLRVKNDLSETMDGLTFIYQDPKQRTYVDAPEIPAFVTLPVGPATNFTIDFGSNGVFDYQAFTTLPFNPATTTIAQIATAITNFGLANNLNVSAVFDPDTDRLKIINIPEPKVVDPGFVQGDFSIDFGQNGVFTYRGFDPQRTTIQTLVSEINLYAQRGGFNIVANYNPVGDTFSITNTTAAATNNQVVFSGANGSAMAAFMRVPFNTASTGGGANTALSVGDIDRFPLVSPLNPLTDVTAFDVANTTIGTLIKPNSQIILGGPNGPALSQFFRLNGTYTLAQDSVTGFLGSQVESYRDIDNSSILSNNNPLRHDLDILPADLPLRPILSYINTTDTTVPAFDFSGPAPVYLHDKVNSRVVSDGTANAGHGLILVGQAQTTDVFDLVYDFHTDSNRLELHFGFTNPEQIDSDGFTFFYDPNNGDINLYQREKDPNKPPILMASFPAAFPVTNVLAGPAHRFAASIDKDAILSVSVDGVTRTFNLFGAHARSGYIAIGHQGNRLEIDNIYADFKGMQNVSATGMLVSMSPTNVSSPDIVERWQERQRTRIVQSALESSTASLTEYVPLLAIAQKVFASISKIISAQNAMIDDINSTLR